METKSAAPKKSGRPRKTLTTKSPLNQITVHLSPELVRALDDEMDTQGMRSRSELIRAACQLYLTQKHQEEQSLSMTRRMRDLSPEQRRQVMAQAADALSDYYRTDPEIAQFHALDGESVYDVDD